jgi:hypothetical protein
MRRFGVGDLGQAAGLVPDSAWRCVATFEESIAIDPTCGAAGRGSHDPPRSPAPGQRALRLSFSLRLDRRRIARSGRNPGLAPAHRRRRVRLHSVPTGRARVRVAARHAWIPRHSRYSTGKAGSPPRPFDNRRRWTRSCSPRVQSLTGSSWIAPSALSATPRPGNGGARRRRTKPMWHPKGDACRVSMSGRPCRSRTKRTPGIISERRCFM